MAAPKNKITVEAEEEVPSIPPMELDSVGDAVLEVSQEWDYGAVKVRFSKKIICSPATMNEQTAIYDKLTKQLDYQHEHWANEFLPKLRRFGKPLVK